MFIQGDVLAFVSFLIGTCFSVWSLTMAYGLLFPAKSAIAQHEISTRPRRCVGMGGLIVLTVGLLGLILVGQVPNPVVKLVGWLLLLSILSVAGLGMAGMAFNASERLRKMAPEMTHYAAFSRGAGFLIIACVVPIVGWFAFGPVLYLASIGAGVKALFTRVEEQSPMLNAEAV